MKARSDYWLPPISPPRPGSSSPAWHMTFAWRDLSFSISSVCTEIGTLVNVQRTEGKDWQRAPITPTDLILLLQAASWHLKSISETQGHLKITPTLTLFLKHTLKTHIFDGFRNAYLSKTTQHTCNSLTGKLSPVVVLTVCSSH